jgi:hypothetical protein
LYRSQPLDRIFAARGLGRPGGLPISEVFIEQINRLLLGRRVEPLANDRLDPRADHGVALLACGR